VAQTFTRLRQKQGDERQAEDDGGRQDAQRAKVQKRLSRVCAAHWKPRGARDDGERDEREHDARRRSRQQNDHFARAIPPRATTACGERAERERDGECEQERDGGERERP
jgi:hypothetical protein